MEDRYDQKRRLGRSVLSFGWSRSGLLTLCLIWLRLIWWLCESPNDDGVNRCSHRERSKSWLADETYARCPCRCRPCTGLFERRVRIYYYIILRVLKSVTWSWVTTTVYYHGHVWHYKPEWICGPTPGYYESSYLCTSNESTDTQSGHRVLWYGTWAYWYNYWSISNLNL